METLKDDGQIRDFDKMDRKIYFEAQNAPYYGAWGAAQNRAMDLARQLPPGQAQELREIVAQLFEGMDEYAGMRFVRGYHIGAASVMEEHGIPGAEAHAQLVPGLENLPVALQEVKRQQRKVFGAQALCSMEVMRSMLLYQSETGLNPDLEKELCGELSEEYQEKLDQLEFMLLDQYSSIADDRFVWGYRLGVRTILDAMSARADGHNG